MKSLRLLAVALMAPLIACVHSPDPPTIPYVAPPSATSAYFPPTTPTFDLSEWTAAGIPEAAASEWTALGATPENARYWIARGVTAAQLAPYARYGLKPADYRPIRDAMEVDSPPTSTEDADFYKDNFIVRHTHTVAATDESEEVDWQAKPPSYERVSNPEAGALNSDQYYRSTDGSEVNRPTYAPSSAYGHETAICEDGTHSYSHHHRGTCSHHGGVEEWED